MSNTALVPVITLLVGVAIGYLAWGNPAGTAASRDLAAAAERLHEHEDMLARIATGGEALAECEAAQARITEKLESCLFDQQRAPAGPAAAEPAQPRSGVSKFTETLDYPVPIEPKAPKAP